MFSKYKSCFYYLTGILLMLCSTSLYAQVDLALNKVASASSILQSPNLAIDGNAATRWESAHGIDPSWLKVDLGNQTALGSVAIVWEAANAANYQVQGSNDNSNWASLATRTGGTFGNRTDTVAISGSYRYVRIYGTARSTGNNWGYSIFSLRVYAAAVSSASSIANTGSGHTISTSNSVKFYANNASWADVHFTINGGGQQNIRMAHNADNTNTYTLSSIPTGATVRYNFTVGPVSGGAFDTAWVQFSCCDTSNPPASSKSASVPSSKHASSKPISSRPISSTIATSKPASIAASSTPANSSLASSIASNIVPLFNSTTALEPVIQFDRGDALVTRISDRGRDRHAKESQFQAYDHFLSFYWEHRTAAIEIVDYVAKGGSVVRMNVTTQFRLNNTEAENRWFYRGVGTVAEFFDNGTMNVVDDLHYYKERGFNAREGRNIQIGDKLEFELSQFLDHNVPHGRSAYYGTTYLYIVGEGLVPWDVTGAFGNLGGTKDSVKISEKAWLGGKTTLPYNHSNEPDNHFIQMATNLSAVNGQAFVLGRRVHHASFVDGSHDENVVDNGTFADTIGKAGTHFVNDRCVGCHVRNGRAAPAPIGQPLEKWVFKVADANSNSHPALGRVLQPKVLGSATSEGQPSIQSWTEANGLRKPNYQFTGVTPPRFSARVAPQLVGMGLLEAIPESTVLAKEDANDTNGDGISGRANRIADPATGQTRLGRFGYKAAVTSLKHQVAAAFNTDMGVMTSLMPSPDCGSSQNDCGPSGAELSEVHFNNIVKYLSTLGVRPQRNFSDAAVQRGETQFANLGCAACHTATLSTSQYHPLGELRSQTIHPYTDLLLHDMGTDMADNLGEGQATGTEWRTAPLWGLGLSACVTGGVTQAAQGSQVCIPVHSYLHDGRARSIEEAILWHGGEGQASKANYQALQASQKLDVLKFLESL
ncbi:MAG: di-heme oxidoredictase family protein [Pseudomonadota bacterium]